MDVSSYQFQYVQDCRWSRRLQRRWYQRSSQQPIPLLKNSALLEAAIGLKENDFLIKLQFKNNDAERWHQIFSTL